MGKFYVAPRQDLSTNQESDSAFPHGSGPKADLEYCKIRNKNLKKKSSFLPKVKTVEKVVFL